MKKKAKIAKQARAFKNYGNSYNIEILDLFIPELKLKNTELAIRNKLKHLLNKLRSSSLL